MAAAATSSPSPASNNNSSDTAAVALLRMETPSKTLRGLNKPKCIQCGNVARSRCPYQCCKSCCFKAQNPCHIHVLKLPPVPLEKSLSSTVVFDQQPTEAPPPVALHRPSTRQPLQANAYKLLFSANRPKKPLTRKEAVAINEWRLSKLREYHERNIEVENDAFDRYMKNVKTLEEVFSMTSQVEDSMDMSSPHSISGNLSAEDDAKEAAQLKSRHRLNALQRENVRSKMKQIVDDGLKKLERSEHEDNNSDLDVQNPTETGLKMANSVKAERLSSLHDLIEKLNRSRNEDDLKSCMELKVQLYSHEEDICSTDKKDASPMEEEASELNFSFRTSCDSLPQKALVTTQIDQEDLIKINKHFLSLDKVGRL